MYKMCSQDDSDRPIKQTWTTSVAIMPSYEKNVLFITGYKRLPVHFSTLPKQMIEQFKEQNERSASITPAMLEKKAGKKAKIYCRDKD